MRYSCDFETTTDPNDCRVWLWGSYNIDLGFTETGKDIESFFDNILAMDSPTIYFHNLKFDGQFIMYELFKRGFKFTNERKPNHGEFTTLITHTGVWYSITISWMESEITIIDSYKLISMPVSAISKAFDIEQLKGEIDYKKFRPVGYDADDKEIAYVINDVEIVGKALGFYLDNGLKKMTQASNALAEFKMMLGSKRFKERFPILDTDIDGYIRRSYKGGWTYVNPKFKSVTINGGKVYDINSLYPWVMYACKLPYGRPMKFRGEYKPHKIFSLYVQRFTCEFELKPDHLPTIQLKKNHRFGETEYLTSSNNEEVEMTLTSVDLELFKEHYKLYNVEYLDGWMFKATDKLFTEYIDKWSGIKIQADKDGNQGMRTIAKLFLNCLYGKFGLNPLVKGKEVVFDGERVRYPDGEDALRDPIYVAMASFITAYARQKTITSAQANYHRFIYADTDSIHLTGHEEVENIHIHPRELGAWKHEYDFDKGYFLRSKAYLEQSYISYSEWSELEVKKQKGWLWSFEYGCFYQQHLALAGLPKSARHSINFDNFKVGTTVQGKLQFKACIGGAVLNETTFTIKG